MKVDSQLYTVLAILAWFSACGANYMSDSSECSEFVSNDWWTYQVCENNVFQFNNDILVSLGSINEDGSFDNGDFCPGSKANRRGRLIEKCCGNSEDRIAYVQEPELCVYEITMCRRSVCGLFGKMSREDTKNLAKEIKDTFLDSFSIYMEKAFPMDELSPLSCEGRDERLTAGNMLTAIDSLDSLVVFGEYDLFCSLADRIVKGLNFDEDRNISLFETTIRNLGGLISGHMLAEDTKLNICENTQHPYEGGLLTLATELANRLLPAFQTNTGIPYGTVNLKYGVPRGETTIASVAGAGSLYLEWGMLSVLSGNPIYREVAEKAVKALYSFRDPKTSLLGRHINTSNGYWTEPLAGLGTNIDSFYEYLVKGYFLFGDGEFWDMFVDIYNHIMTYLPNGAFYSDCDMKSGRRQTTIFNALDAFWPGVQASIGELYDSSFTLNAFYSILNLEGTLPENFNFATGEFVAKRKQSLLRPELIESTWHHFLASKDRTWLDAGKHFWEGLKNTRTECGFASYKDITLKVKQDYMPSFLFSETFKYLYLIMDEENYFNKNAEKFVFTTEAHIFRIPRKSEIPRSADVPLSHLELQSNESTTQKLSKIKFSNDKESPEISIPVSKDQEIKTENSSNNNGGHRSVNHNLRSATCHNLSALALEEINLNVWGKGAIQPLSSIVEDTIEPYFGEIFTLPEISYDIETDSDFLELVNDSEVDAVRYDSFIYFTKDIPAKDALPSRLAERWSINGKSRERITIDDVGHYMRIRHTLYTKLGDQWIFRNSTASDLFTAMPFILKHDSSFDYIEFSEETNHPIQCAVGYKSNDENEEEWVECALGTLSVWDSNVEVTAPLIWPKDRYGCKPYAPYAFHDSIAVLARGDCYFQDKLTHASHAGAVGVIIINDDKKQLINMASSTVDYLAITPAVMISKDKEDWLSKQRYITISLVSTSYKTITDKKLIITQKNNNNNASEESIEIMSIEDESIAWFNSVDGIRPSWGVWIPLYSYLTETPDFNVIHMTNSPKESSSETVTSD